MNEIIFNEDQEVAISRMIAFLDDPVEEIFTLEGIAGAGKTTILRYVIAGRSNVIACCISHVAKSVLIENMGGIAKCITLAQLLGLKMTITDEGEIEFLPRPSSDPNVPLPVHTANIIIVDEASQVDDRNYDLLISMKKPNCKIIFCGDPFQTPPIDKDKKDSDSKAFDSTQAQLIKTMRYDGFITDFGSRIRTEISKIRNGKAGSKFVVNEWCSDMGFKGRNSVLDEKGNGIIFLNDINDVINITKYHFQDSKMDEIRLLGFRRDSIDTLNDVLRAQLYADEYGTVIDEDEIDLPQFIPGELIINTGGYKDIIHNNQSFKIESFFETIGPSDVPCLSLILDPMPNLREGQQILVVDEVKGKRKYLNILKQLKDNASNDKRQWPAYYNFKDKFCSFEYSLAINVHRAQGSTYNNVIVFENDILNIKKNSTKAKLQAIYVACTRARKRVYIYNNRYKVYQDGLSEEIKNELKLR